MEINQYVMYIDQLQAAEPFLRVEQLWLQVTSRGRNQRAKARKSEVRINTTYRLDEGCVQPTVT